MSLVPVGNLVVVQMTVRVRILILVPENGQELGVLLVLEKVRLQLCRIGSPPQASRVIQNEAISVLNEHISCVTFCEYNSVWNLGTEERNLEPK